MNARLCEQQQNQPSVLVRISVMLCLAALVLAIYWPALGFGYVRFDDPEYVTGNHYVQSGRVGGRVP